MNLISEINRFNDEIGVESADTPPASWYTNSAFDDLDADVLKKYWQFVASVDQFPQVGSYVAGSFCGESYFVIRTESNELKAYYNVCRHHAAELLAGEGCTKEIVCPYHAWTYDINGSLKKAPHMAGVKNFKRENLSLKEISLKIWNKFVLLNFSDKPMNLDEDFNRFDELLKKMNTDKLKFYGRRVYEIKCNWKVYIDNYLDGGYHVDHLHKGLAGQLSMNEYKVENYKTWTLQSCVSAENPVNADGLDFKERIGGGAYYAWFHPNFMINRYGDIMDVNWIVPNGTESCYTIFDYYFLEGTDKTFIENSIKASEKVQIEDVDICQSVQRGLKSKGYDTGRYAPTLEGGAYLFHVLMKKDYCKALNLR